MNYCLTMEQTRRIAVWFDADSDVEAEKKAREIYHNTPSKDFEAGRLRRRHGRSITILRQRTLRRGMTRETARFLTGIRTRWCLTGAELCQKEQSEFMWPL